MRRLSLAAVCGTLILAACSDQSPTEPAPPPRPEQSLASCRPAHHFPIIQVSALIVQVFPRGRLRLEALARAGATALLWETCKKPLAQRSAIEFVNFMNANSSKLIGTQTQRNTLISLVLNGVDIPFTTPPGGTGDFGVGFFDPGKTTNTVVKTLNGTALVELEPGSFDQPTSIVISRKSDGFTLTDFDGDQFPPYFDYDAINAAGDHVLKNGKTAIVAFCLLDPVYTYPENPRIGHNPVAGAPGSPFEVLEEVNLAEGHLGLAAQLNCGNLNPNTIIIGGFGRGLPGLANAAWKTARYYLAPAVQNLFLPEALHAATFAVGTLPPPAGRAPSLSPFGVVNSADALQSTTTQITNDNPDPSTPDQSYTVSFTVTSPSEGTPTGDVLVTDGNEGSCTASVDAGSCEMPPSPVGEYTLTAAYLGNSSFASSSGTETHTVTAAPPENLIINFDVGPDGETPVPNGAVVNTLYAPLGITFQHAGTGAACGTDVRANANQPEGFGSPPNVVSFCGPTTASDISENTFGLIQANLSTAAEQVCVETRPDFDPEVLHVARMDAFDAAGTLIGSASTSPSNPRLCVTVFPAGGIRRVQFSGDQDKFARFDDFEVRYSILD